MICLMVEMPELSKWFSKYFDKLKFCKFIYGNHSTHGALNFYNCVSDIYMLFSFLPPPSPLKKNIFIENIPFFV